MTDFFLLLDKIEKLNHSLLRPRLICQKGVALSGSFYCYISLGDYTAAPFFQDPNQEVSVTARFSNIMGGIGGGDSHRDTRGFAVRFLTDTESCDLLCHNMPVYAIRDPLKFPELIESLAASQKTPGEPPGFWRFLSENPEAITLALYLYTNKGTVKSYRFMEGYSVNTYKWINKQKEELYVRYRWIPLCKGDEQHEGRKGISYQEAEFLAGFSPDCCAADLGIALEEGNFPVFELEVQIMDKKQAAEWGDEFLSTTLMWPEEHFPYFKIGKMILKERLPKEQEEKLYFAPSNLTEGIALANEPFVSVLDFILKADARQRGVLK